MAVQADVAHQRRGVAGIGAVEGPKAIGADLLSYFVVGIFALAFCLAMAIKPNFFKPKDPDDLPYPVWSHEKNFEMIEGF